MPTEERNLGKIESITVKLRTRDGVARQITVDPDENDALFWSGEAMDKLALPFYFASRSREQALAVRRQVDEQMLASGYIIAAHKRLCTLLVADLSRHDPPSSI